MAGNSNQYILGCKSALFFLSIGLFSQSVCNYTAVVNTPLLFPASLIEVNAGKMGSYSLSPKPTEYYLAMITT